jgi:hypothetical protein
MGMAFPCLSLKKAGYENLPNPYPFGIAKIMTGIKKDR